MKCLIIIFCAVLMCAPAFSNENHDEHDEKSGHADHKEGESGDHGETKSESIGPGKGIVSADEANGFQISLQAEKNFEIKRLKVVSVGEIRIPKTAVVTAGVEVNLYRFRNGNYKRIDFDVIKKTDDKISIKSKDLKNGDEIVVEGTGLLRIAELAAFGGSPEGHSH